MHDSEEGEEEEEADEDVSREPVDSAHNYFFFARLFTQQEGFHSDRNVFSLITPLHP